MYFTSFASLDYDNTYYLYMRYTQYAGVFNSQIHTRAKLVEFFKYHAELKFFF